MVGSLLYLSRTTRWDISYAVPQKLTRATSKPSTAHLKKAKHVLRYLKGHQELDIVYRSGYQTSGICRREFCQRSRWTQVYKWLHLSFFWNTHLMGLVASIAHGFKHRRKWASGYHPLYEASLPPSRRTTWAQKFNGFEKFSIGNDSTGALSVVSIDGYSTRTKHLQQRKWFYTERIESGRISVHHVPTEILPASIFTKTTTKAVHRKLVDLIQAYASWRSKPEHCRVIQERIMFDLFF